MQGPSMCVQSAAPPCTALPPAGCDTFLLLLPLPPLLRPLLPSPSIVTLARIVTPPLPVSYISNRLESVSSSPPGAWQQGRRMWGAHADMAAGQAHVGGTCYMALLQ
jgi:hypothetical protein